MREPDSESDEEMHVAHFKTDLGTDGLSPWQVQEKATVFPKKPSNSEYKPINHQIASPVFTNKSPPIATASSLLPQNILRKSTVRLIRSDNLTAKVPQPKILEKPVSSKIQSPKFSLKSSYSINLIVQSPEQTEKTAVTQKEIPRLSHQTRISTEKSILDTSFRPNKTFDPVIDVRSLKKISETNRMLLNSSLDPEDHSNSFPKRIMKRNQKVMAQLMDVVSGATSVNKEHSYVVFQEKLPQLPSPQELIAQVIERKGSQPIQLNKSRLKRYGATVRPWMKLGPKPMASGIPTTGNAIDFAKINQKDQEQKKPLALIPLRQMQSPSITIQQKSLSGLPGKGKKYNE